MADRETLRDAGPTVDRLLGRRLLARKSERHAPKCDDWDGPHADRYPALRGSEALRLPPEALAEREARVLAHQARVEREEAAIRAALAATRAAGRALRVRGLGKEGAARKAAKNAALAGLREARQWTTCQRCGRLFRQPYRNNTPQKTCSRRCPAWVKKEAS